MIATFGFSDDGRVELTLSLNLEAAIAGIGAGHEDTDESAAAPLYNRLRGLPPEDLSAEFDRFVPTLRDRIALMLGDRPVMLDTANASIPEVGDTDLPRISEVTLAGPAPDAARVLTWRFDPTLGDSVMRFRAARSGEIIRAEFLRAGQTADAVTVQDLAPQGSLEVFANHLRIGFVHIVPKGLDHILFVIGLFLLSAGASALLWQISAFTLAHTVTLALGVSGIVTVSPAIVEPLIAASVFYVAVENGFTDRLNRWRLPVVFCFGLLHGLGFAGILGEIGLSPQHFALGLVGFNLGVELGQLAVIAAAFLAVGWAARRPWYRHGVTIPGSLAIATVAAYWVVQRVALT